MPLVLSYEVDLWGRVRRPVEAAEADVQSAVADYQNMLLSLQAELARNYTALRVVDNEIVLLDQTVKLRTETRDSVKSRFDNGLNGLSA